MTSFPETLALAEQGRKQVLSVEDWAEIRRLRRSEQMPIAQIARVLGISRNTVKSALASDGPPKYQRPPRGSVADARVRRGAGSFGADRLVLGTDFPYATGAVFERAVGCITTSGPAPGDADRVLSVNAGALFSRRDP